jgi:Polysaccharide pyruvyl transferase
MHGHDPNRKGLATPQLSPLETKLKKFCLINYSGTANLGDEIQSLAARQFLPQVDRFVDRERLQEFRSEAEEEQYWVIMNGWFCHFPENWPPSPSLRPLLVSFHISSDPGGAGGVGLSAQDILLSRPFRNYLSGFGPVGARDLPTLKRLQAAGIDSYFSGCLTLTLTRPDVARDDGLIVLNDVPASVGEAVRRMTDKKIVHTNHWDGHTTESNARFKLAEGLLSTYAKASCVITSRLHSALPCTAMGTPVLLVDTASDQDRFDGLNQFVRHFNVQQFLEGASGFDVNKPTPNPDTHIPYAMNLRERVKQFIEAPALPLAAYPLSARDIDDGLRLINKRTADLLFGEKSARITLEKRLTQAPVPAESA